MRFQQSLQLLRQRIHPHFLLPFHQLLHPPPKTRGPEEEQVEFVEMMGSAQADIAKSAGAGSLEWDGVSLVDVD